jgi:hypothetical protein
MVLSLTPMALAAWGTERAMTGSVGSSMGGLLVFQYLW